MLELNFHDETEKAKPLKRRGTEDAEEQGAEAKGGRRRSKFEGGEANAAAKCASCVSAKRSGRGLQPIMKLISASAKARCEVIVPVR
jgi:hypothetical protein